MPYAARLHANVEAVTHYTSASKRRIGVGIDDEALRHQYLGRDRSIEGMAVLLDTALRIDSAGGWSFDLPTRCGPIPFMTA